MQLIGQSKDLNQLLVMKLRCQLLESVYQYVHEHNKGNRDWNCTVSICNALVLQVSI